MCTVQNEVTIISRQTKDNHEIHGSYYLETIYSLSKLNFLNITVAMCYQDPTNNFVIYSLSFLFHFWMQFPSPPKFGSQTVS